MTERAVYHIRMLKGRDFKQVFSGTVNTTEKPDHRGVYGIEEAALLEDTHPIDELSVKLDDGSFAPIIRASASDALVFAEPVRVYY